MVDYNSTWTVDNPLSGSSPQERWAVVQDRNVAVGNASFSLRYYHQYSESVSYRIFYGDIGLNTKPALAITRFGQSNSTALTRDSATIWADTNSKWSLDENLQGVSGERWNLTPTKGNFSRSGNFSFDYAHQYLLTMLTDPPSVGSITPMSGWQNAGTVIKIMANSSRNDYSFLNWSGDGAGHYSGPDRSAQVTMNEPITETAHFQAAVNVVIVTSNGTQSVSVDNETFTLNYSAYWSTNSTHTITAKSGSTCGYTIGPLVTCQWKFKAWYATNGTRLSSNNALELRADKTRTIVGVWERDYFNIVMICVGLALIASLVVLLTRRKHHRHPLIEPTIPSHREASELRYSMGAFTDVGKVRSNNEDSILAMELLSSFESRSRSSILCAVADGVGGSQKGEMASRLALQTLAEKGAKFLLGSGRGEIGDALRSAIEAVNEAVIKYGMEHSESEGMATTIVASLIDGGTVYIANAGDSRAYLINRGQIKQLTRDDSQVQEAVDSGKITPEQARHYPGRNIITKAVGGATDIELSISNLSLAPGDRILLCSDGLWEPLGDAEIQKITLESSNPQSACEKLVSLANERGGKDNSSVIIVEAQKEMAK